MHNTAAIRCLLMLCLWQGPLPVWHTHGTLAEAPAASRSWLAEHLADHHAEVDPREVVVFGWHVHFDLPESEGDPDDTPGPSLRFPVVVSTGSDGVRPGSSERLPIVADSLLTLVIDPPAEPTAGSHSIRRGFFPDDAASLPLPLRIGVSRC